MRLPQGCVARAATLYGLFLFAVLGLGLGGAHAFASWRLRSEHRAWAALGTSMDALSRRFPPGDNSPAARELDGITRRLGIRVAPDGPARSPVDDPKLGDVLGRYAASMQQSSDDALAAPDAAVEAFLDEHRRDLEDVARHLAASSDVKWEMDLDSGPEAPLPSLLAHRQLHTLLVADGVRRLLRGDGGGADAMLTAAWRQRETLADRPEVVCQLISMSLASDELAVLRRWRRPPPAWKDRLRQYRFRERFVDALQADVYGWLVLTREYRGAADLRAGPRDGGLVAWGVRIATVPYVRLSVAGISRHTRRGREMVLADTACSRGSDALGKEVLRGIPRWHTIPRTAVPSLVSAWTSAVRGDLDVELTDLVLKARDRVPVAPVNVPSRVCRGLQWLHGPAPDGGSTIHAELAPDLVREHGNWSFTLSPAGR
jgi:hypothetical protein